VIVIDASAAVAALLNAGPSRQMLAEAQLPAPHLIDTEVANALRGKVRSGEIPAGAGWAALNTLGQLGITRYPGSGLGERVWELRDNLSAYDATYVALAEQLTCSLVTADGRVSRAPGIRCAVSVVPS
jgi:predicted nucleic acid-binding protein